MNQRTPEWFAARVGHVTASRVADVIAKIKSGEAASRANYRAQLVAERLTGTPAELFSNAAMDWGIATEPQARAAYESHTGELVTEVGFIKHPSIQFSGASPDGVVLCGLVEIKCPNTATHIDTLIAQAAPAKYIPQMQWQMACTGAEWCDFVSFDPRMPERLQLFVVNVKRDDESIKIMEEEVMKFLAEVQDTITKLENI